MLLMMPISVPPISQDTNCIVEQYRPHATESSYTTATPKRWLKPTHIKELDDVVLARLIGSPGWIEDSKLQSIYDLAAKLSASSSDLDPDFAKILRDNFWDLI